MSDRCCVWMPRSSADVHEIFSTSLGSAMIEELPRVTDTGASSVKYSRSISCSTGSPWMIMFTYGRAEPSMTGGSEPSISIMTLSIPQPCSALRTCSTV